MDIQMQDHGALARLAAYPAAQDAALTRALNRTNDWSKTRTVKMVAAQVNVKQKDLREKFIKTQRATYTRQMANMTVTGGRISLSKFSGKPALPPVGQRQTGIKYKIQTDGGVTMLKGNAFAVVLKWGGVAFMRRLPDQKHVRVMARTGKRAGKWIWSAKALALLWGPSVPLVAQGLDEFQALLKVQAGERLEMQMEREVNFILTGSSKGVEPAD